MKACKDCIHEKICLHNANIQNDTYAYMGIKYYIEDCKHFKLTTDVVDVETIKMWLYEMAINNVGCVYDGDFSVACEEIISRLDGLRMFAKERNPQEGKEL